MSSVCESLTGSQDVKTSKPLLGELQSKAKLKVRKLPELGMKLHQARDQQETSRMLPSVSAVIGI